MKKVIIVLILAVTSITILSCSRKVVYSKPTMSQVNDFVDQETIKVKAIKETSDFMIILFQDNNISGHYSLYQDQDGKLYNSKVEGASRGVNPVCLGGVATGREPFVTVIINDDEIYNQANYLEVTFSDGNVIKESVEKRGIVVVYPKDDNKGAIYYSSIVIYDKDNKAIYEN